MNNEWYERRILNDIKEIESRIRELESEKLGLQRVLTRLRRESVSTKEVGRRNSIDRVLIERQVLEYLRARKKPARAWEIYNAAKEVSFSLKENTFRSYLHRMKKSGLIKNPGGQRGLWMSIDKIP